MAHNPVIKKISVSLARVFLEFIFPLLIPFDFNVPQTRDRLYIVAKRNKLNGFTWPVKETKKINLNKYISKNPKIIKKVSSQRKKVIKTWELFFKKIPKRNYLPNPLWTMEFGATYPFEKCTPYSMTVSYTHLTLPTKRIV